MHAGGDDRSPLAGLFGSILTIVTALNENFKDTTFGNSQLSNQRWKARWHQQASKGSSTADVSLKLAFYTLLEITHRLTKLFWCYDDCKIIMLARFATQHTIQAQYSGFICSVT